MALDFGNSPALDIPACWTDQGSELIAFRIVAGTYTFPSEDKLATGAGRLTRMALIRTHSVRFLAAICSRHRH